MQIALNYSLDTVHKQGRFFKTLAKKSFKLISSRKCSILLFDLSFILLHPKIDLIAEEQSRKKHMLKVYSIDYIKMILLLPTKVLALNM